MKDMKNMKIMKGHKGLVGKRSSRSLMRLHARHVLHVVIAIVLGGAAPLGAQRVLDEVLVRFGGEIVTQLDVRQARMLKLVEVSSDTDEAYVDALVNRRLILADLRRTPPPEPGTGAVDARYQEWLRRVGPGANLDDLLAQAGMTETALRGWLRDDVRIEAYMSDRFGGRPGDLDSWISVLRQRAGLQ
jgi:hypothetical protein